MELSPGAKCVLETLINESFQGEDLHLCVTENAVSLASAGRPGYELFIQRFGSPYIAINTVAGGFLNIGKEKFNVARCRSPETVPRDKALEQFLSSVSEVLGEGASEVVEYTAMLITYAAELWQLESALNQCINDIERLRCIIENLCFGNLVIHTHPSTIVIHINVSPFRRIDVEIGKEKVNMGIGVITSKEYDVIIRVAPMDNAVGLDNLVKKLQQCIDKDPDLLDYIAKELEKLHNDADKLCKRIVRACIAQRYLP